MVDIIGKTSNKDITEAAMAGVHWNPYSTVAIAIMQLSFGIVLARIIAPESFGLFFYAMIFVGFVSVYARAGIPEAIIQCQKLTKEHIDAGFTLSLLMNLSATIGLWVLAQLLQAAQKL